MTSPEYSYFATVTRWVDGDTVDMHVDLGFKLFAETRFRVLGLDTPERGQANYVEARVLAESLVPVGTTLPIKVHKVADKYGRWLVELSTPDGRSLPDVIIEAGLGLPYFGGHRG